MFPLSATSSLHPAGPHRGPIPEVFQSSAIIFSLPISSFTLTENSFLLILTRQPPKIHSLFISQTCKISSNKKQLILVALVFPPHTLKQTREFGSRHFPDLPDKLLACQRYRNPVRYPCISRQLQNCSRNT